MRIGVWVFSAFVGLLLASPCWAQAVTFATAKAELDLDTARKQDFSLQPNKDFVRQLPGNVMLNALP